MRREISSNKTLIIRAERVFINFLFSLFTDLYIHNISLELIGSSGQREILVHFLTYKERGIAIGRGVEYIKCVNELFKRYIRFENKNIPIEIKCKKINL